MIIASIEPSLVNGTVNAPPNKSVMQRACALALLNTGNTTIQNPGKSNDDIAAINIIKQLGAQVNEVNGSLVINSTGKISPVDSLHCEESGLAFRMFAPIAALTPSAVTLHGSGSLLTRPMHFIDDVYPLLNVKTNSANGFLPVTLHGPLLPANISIDGSFSSQYLTGILFAFSSAVKELVSINVRDLKSKPYIDLSLQMLGDFGYNVIHDQYTDFYVRPVERKEKNLSCVIEADWSGASFLLVAGAIAGTAHVSGLNIHSLQADRMIIQVLERCNADVNISRDIISVSNKNKTDAFEFDATDCPDLFPALVALAAHSEGRSVIKGVSRLISKESNRAESLTNVFSKMGVEVMLEDDAMMIAGGKKLKPAILSSHHDHRIAMACAVAALNASGPVTIHNAEAVNKSYPDFYRHLEMLGATVSLFNDQVRS